MAKRIDRRQFLKQGKAALLGFSGFNLFNLVSKYPGLGQLNTNKSAETAIATLEKQIPKLMKKAGVPGLSIAIVSDAKIFWSRGFGVKNTETGEPVDTNTVFAAASLSKPVFAYEVLKMCARGELNLDTPLTEYMDKPSYIEDDPRVSLITTRLVLSHTAGFPNWSDDPVTIDFKPGSKFSYSGEGYIYLQKVVEYVTGEPLNEYITRNLLDPLGMTSSSYVWREEYEWLAADGHDRSGNVVLAGKSDEAISAGSLCTTATDFAKFAIAMMSSTKDPFRLTQQSVDQMLREQIKINQTLGWGLGWGLEHTPDGDFFWHWGDLGVFKSFTLASRKLRSGIVILTNSENGLRICENIVRMTIGGQHPAFGFDMIEY